MKKKLLSIIIAVVILASWSFNDIKAYKSSATTSEETIVQEPVGPLEPIGPSQPYSYRVNTKYTDLNVRSGPGTKYPVIGSVARGSIVDCSFMQPGNTNGKWSYGSGIDVKTKKRIYGYMSNEYLVSISQG